MCYTVSRASVEKFSGGGNRKKTKNSTIKPLPGGNGNKDREIALISLYPLYLYYRYSVPCMKIKAGGDTASRCGGRPCTVYFNSWSVPAEVFSEKLYYIYIQYKSHSVSLVYIYLSCAHFYQVEKYLHKGLFRLERSEAERVNRKAQVLTSLMLKCWRFRWWIQIVFKLYSMTSYIVNIVVVPAVGMRRNWGCCSVGRCLPVEWQ